MRLKYKTYNSDKLTSIMDGAQCTDDDNGDSEDSMMQTGMVIILQWVSRGINSMVGGVEQDAI